MKLTFLSLAFACAIALPAAAEAVRWVMFPSDGACYLRQYSRDHLAANQNQMVTQIAIGPEYGQAEAAVLVLRVAVYVRGSDEQFRGSAYCDTRGGSLSCWLEGDAGQFSLTPAKNGAIKLQVGTSPLLFEGKRGYLGFGAEASDDNTFLIPRVPADACP